MFNVVGEANGIVDHSAVTQTGGPDGSADFQLRAALGAASARRSARLSDLRGAQVASRTDNSQDVNSQYVSANRQLADDQALRTGLLKQLAAAVTQQQIDSAQGPAAATPRRRSPPTRRRCASSTPRSTTATSR